MEDPANRRLPADAFPLFQGGIKCVLSRWSALQLAVENEWGGRDSLRKSELLCSDIFTWFTQNKGNFAPIPLDVLGTYFHALFLSSYSVV